MGTEKKMAVLQLFNDYLPETQIWIFNLLKPITLINYIGSHSFTYMNFQVGSIPFNNLISKFNQFLLKDYQWLPILKISRVIYGILGKLRIYCFFLAFKSKKHDIKIIHAHFANAGWDFLFLKKLTGLPYIVSFYGWDYEHLLWKYPKYKKRYLKMFGKADLFLCEGNSGKNKLIQLGCPAEKIKLQRLGVDVSKIPFLNRLKKEKELRLIQVATFKEKKGHIYGVKALHAVIKQCPNITLTLAGSNPADGTKDLIDEYIEKHSLRNRITVRDFIPYQDMIGYLQEFHVFIHPSIHTESKDSEGGAPIVLLDAQATGMPVLSTYHCDIPEEVIHNKTGLLVPERDIDGLSENIVRFYKMDQLEYNQFARAAREHIVQNYDLEVCRKNLESLYHSILTN